MRVRGDIIILFGNESNFTEAAATRTVIIIRRRRRLNDCNPTRWCGRVRARRPVADDRDCVKITPPRRRRRSHEHVLGDGNGDTALRRRRRIADVMKKSLSLTLFFFFYIRQRRRTTDDLLPVAISLNKYAEPYAVPATTTQNHRIRIVVCSVVTRGLRRNNARVAFSSSSAVRAPFACSNKLNNVYCADGHAKNKLRYTNFVILHITFAYRTVILNFWGVSSSWGGAGQVLWGSGKNRLQKEEISNKKKIIIIKKGHSPFVRGLHIIGMFEEMSNEKIVGILKIFFQGPGAYAQFATPNFIGTGGDLSFVI